MAEDKRIEKLLAKVFDRAQAGLREEIGPAEYDQRRRDFVFHMLDWRTDLEKMAALADDPRSMSSEEATTFVIGFLYHVVPHLNAAGRLLLDEIRDPFASEVQGDRKVRSAPPLGTS
jgi:hypothetical protein